MLPGRTNIPNKIMSFSYGFIFITLHHIVYNMGAKSSTQRERLFYTILPIAFTLVQVYHQVVAHLQQNATELVTSLKHANFGLFLKNRFFFRKKIQIFPKSLKVPNVL